MRIVDAVKEFHSAYGVPVLAKPTIPAADRCDLRAKLINEEASELLEAMIKGDLVEVADGIADLLYVTIGTALEFGLADVLGDVFAEVHRSNMSKLGPDGKPILRADGKVLKSPNWSPPMLAPLIKNAQAL